MTPQELIPNLLDISDEDQRRTFLDDHRADLNLKVIEELKAQADQWLLRDTRRALQIAEVALEAASFLSDPLALALARWAKGNALIYLGKHEACLALYREAMALYAERGLSLEVARLQTNAVFALTNLGRYEEALAQADSARAELERHGPTRYLATLEQNVGIACRHLGRYEQALAAYERAQAIFQALDDPVKVAEMQVNRSKVLENLDDFRQAMALLEKARPVFEVHEQAVTVARTDLNIATLLFRQGRYQEALEAYERARQGFATLGNDVEVAVVDLYRSSVHLALNLFPEALELATQARRALAERGMARQVALATARQAAAQRGLGELDEAGRLFEEARDIWVETGAEVEAALLDLERAALWRVQGRPQKALLLAEASAEVFNQRGMSVRSGQARLLMAECQADLGQPAEAEKLYQAVLEAPLSKELASLAYRAHHGLGRIEERRERREAACRHYQQAVTHIEAMQRDLRVDEFKASFLDDKLEVYQALVHTLLALGRPEEAFEVVERAKSGVLLDFLTSLDLHRLAPPSVPPKACPEQGRRVGGDEGGARELWERLQALKEEWHWHYRKIEGRAAEGDPLRSSGMGSWQALRRIEAESRETWWELQRRDHRYAALTPAEGVSLAEVQEYLDEDSLLLEYFAIGQQLVAFLVSREGLSVVTDFPFSIQEVERSLAVLELTLKGVGSLAPEYVEEVLTPASREHLRWLYRALLVPLGDVISCYGKLIIAPHDALHYLPFHALHDGQRYLIETHQVQYVPAASILPFCHRKEETRFLPALIMGYSDGGRLPYVEGEVEAVAACVPRPRLFTEDEATLSRLREQAGECGLLHLAAHGVFRGDNPLFSFLQLADEPLRLLDVYGLKLRADLVTLSACETGMSQLKGGDLIGLCRGFFYAGASSLVVSLWRVDDEATAELMTSFYRGLVAGKATCAALREAQLEILSRYRHPYYWAPFVLVGV